MPRKPDEVPGSVKAQLQSLGHREDGPGLEALGYGQDPMLKLCQRKMSAKSVFIS